MQINITEHKDEIHIDEFDVWDMDCTLALIIVPMLELLKKIQFGASDVDDSDVPDNIRSKNAKPKEEGDTDEFHNDRWNWVLDEMIWSFTKIKTNTRYTKRVRNGTRLFGKYYSALWD